MKNRSIFNLACLLVLLGGYLLQFFSGAQAGDEKGKGDKKDKVDKAGIEFFENKILPILKQHCYECHSADSVFLEGNLLLDTKAGMLKGGNSGPALVPGQPEKSLIIKTLKYTDEDLQMPPEGKLPEQVIANFEKWIKMGAPDLRGVKAPAKP